RGRTHGDGGTFWTWREVMYSIAGRLTPENYETDPCSTLTPTATRTPPDGIWFRAPDERTCTGARNLRPGLASGLG
ncbi:hypothetical protein, partial [Brevibacterium sp. NPDC056947]|uniref:hypothetical protein n=1 Tax=Brevibacterium sp. NPDC056947 TaxID=3345974 RepID=UPI00362C2E46